MTTLKSIEAMLKATYLMLTLTSAYLPASPRASTVVVFIVQDIYSSLSSATSSDSRGTEVIRYQKVKKLGN